MHKYASFDNFFEIIIADTPRSKNIHYRLRYQVYCEELGFEDKTQYPGQMEFDTWDKHSVHFLVRNRYSGAWLGTLRVVFHNSLSFPFESRCSADQQLAINDYLQSVEISRLCVIKEARRFQKSAPSLATDQKPTLESSNKIIHYLHTHHAKQRCLMWGLLRAAVVYSAEHNLKHWFFLATQSLAQCIQKAGFEMEKIGLTPTDAGQRYPYKLNVENFLNNPMWQNDYRRGYLKFSELEEKTEWQYKFG